MGWRSTSLSSPIVPIWVRSSSGCGTDDCGRTSATSRPSTRPSPPSTRPSDARGRRSSAFVRERHAPIDAPVVFPKELAPLVDGARENVNETSNRSSAGEQASRAGQRSQAKLWVAVGIAIAVVATAWLAYSYRQSDAAASAAPAALPQVAVSKPLEREVDSRLGFLGQFSAVEQVELHAQVGGTLTGIHFKDGDIVHQGDLLFTIDPRPYEFRLAQAHAQLETANARLVLAGRELHRAEVLAAKAFGTEQTVDQRTADQRTGQAAVDDGKAQIRDAEFDLEHCRITAPFTGRIGTHLVSVGNLIAGSRTATSPTTLLTTLVSLDPIYLDFDMSESDFLTFSRDRARVKGGLADKVEIALSNK